jgi:hypothetical protein
MWKVWKKASPACGSQDKAGLGWVMIFEAPFGDEKEVGFLDKGKAHAKPQTWDITNHSVNYTLRKRKLGN